MKKIKCLFVNDEMVVGGVSKVLVNLLARLDKERYDIDLLVLHAHGDYLKEIPEGVRLIKGNVFFDVCDIPIEECKKNGKFLKKVYFASLLKSGLIKYQIKKQRKRMKLEKYDVEIAFKEGFCSIFTAYGDSKKKINWIHADYLVQNYAANYMATMEKALKLFDQHVAVSNRAASSFETVFKLDDIKTIHNVMSVDNIINKSKEELHYRNDVFTMIAVGRLHFQKSFDRLLETMDLLRKRNVLTEVFVLGDGELKDELEKQ